MRLDDVTPLILTFNEDPNLRQSLNALSWAKQIVVIDSGSTDATLAIAAEYPHVTVYHREFDNHTAQWNHGLQKIDTEWVLTLDADYISPPELPAELLRIEGASDVHYARFRYCIGGRPLRSSLYPPRAILFRPTGNQYIQDGHTQTLDVAAASTGFLESVWSHDDQKPFSRWCASQVKYAQLESSKLQQSDSAELGWKDRLRKMIVFAPGLTLIYCLFVRRLILDGWPGIYYSFQRTLAELVLSLVLLERKIRRDR